MSLVLEIIAKIGLFFCQTYVLASIFLIGFFFINKKIFSRTLLLVLFTMIYNVYLKSIWKMPLPPPLEGWGFPSGHMHTAVVFWGWLAYEYHKAWYYEITFFLLCLIGYGILYHGYHYPIDILGAIGFGLLSIILYALLQRLPYFKEKLYRLGYLLILLSLGILLLLGSNFIKPHQWQALTVLIGFTVACTLLQYKSNATS
ncbi:MAG: phosphatase PAP2 family protein [Gammaproteobacteria bacterium]|jgi:membrane-associated phospholipid phosphatase|nr:phosphatase PAP2 family protein [Gammaproteobacteria bacterium]